MLEIVPMTLREANAFVEQNHRHHGPVVGHKFSIGLSDGEQIVGVAIVGRPVARHMDDGWTLDVNRLCTDGSRNACSMLYAAAWRAARAMGYKRLVTYILESENGASCGQKGRRGQRDQQDGTALGAGGGGAMKPIDKSKKSNIKCEHCGHWTGWQTSNCLLSGLDKNYWNRCKLFCWREDKEYVGEEQAHD